MVNASQTDDVCEILREQVGSEHSGRETHTSHPTIVEVKCRVSRPLINAQSSPGKNKALVNKPK
eukprot:COSAG05_NODE_1465_length_4804_cov_372.506270_4_plen_64_part_00